jgi:hypothetical protein
MSETEVLIDIGLSYRLFGWPFVCLAVSAGLKRSHSGRSGVNCDLPLILDERDTIAIGNRGRGS